MTSTVDFLEQFDEEWEGTEAEEGERGLPPPGKYTWEVVDCELKQASDRCNFIWKLKIAEGPLAGRFDWKWSGLNPNNFPNFKRDVTLCRVKLGRLSELPKHLDDFVGLFVAGEVSLSKRTDKEGKPYRNVYFKKLVDRPEGAEAADVW